MKKRTLLITTILGAGALLGQMPIARATDAVAVSAVTLPATTNSIVANTVAAPMAPLSNEVITDPRIAAQSFLAHVNYARVALAMKDGDLAQQHITQARNMIVIIMNVATDQRLVTRVEAGRVYYEYDTEHKYNYFPVETGRIEIKEVDNGPLWAKNSLAVSDAEIVYLSLDLTHNKAESYLAEAEAKIKSGDLKQAEVRLGALTDEIVTVDEKVSVPVDKAHDNIGIAQSFIKSQNYDGARFALGHADAALDEMQKDDLYKEHRANIAAMRQEVKDMRDDITKKDPTLMQKAGDKIEKWMNELKAWTKK